MAIRVLLADDHALVRAGFRMILEAEPDIEVVGEAEDLVQALGQAELLRPTIILMDARLADRNDREAIRRIKEWMPNVKILCLTVHSREIEPALSAGADAHLIKDGERQELLKALRSLALRE